MPDQRETCNDCMIQNTCDFWMEMENHWRGMKQDGEYFSCKKFVQKQVIK